MSEIEGHEIFLYWGSGSGPCWRIQIVLEEKNIQYGHKLLSFDKNEHKSEEVLRVNPRGQLPAFKIGNTWLNESIGACLYLEDKYKQQGTNLIPDDNKSLVFQRMFEALNLQKYCQENILYYIWRTPADKLDKDYLEQKKKELNVEIARWEAYLVQQRSKYLSGNEFTMADVIFFPQLAFPVRMGYPLEKFPKLKEYYDLVKERKSIKDTWPPHWKNSPNPNHLSDC